MAGAGSNRPASRTYSRGKGNADRSEPDEFDMVKESLDPVATPKSWSSKGTWGRKSAKRKEPDTKAKAAVGPSPFDWDEAEDFSSSPSSQSVVPAGLAKKSRSMKKSGSPIVNVSVKTSVTVTASMSLKGSTSLTSCGGPTKPSSGACKLTLSEDVGSFEEPYTESSQDETTVTKSKSAGDLSQNGFNGLLFSKQTRRTLPNENDITDLIYNSNSEPDDTPCPSQTLKRSATIGATGSPMRSIVEEMQAPSDSRLQAARRNITSALSGGDESNSSELKVPSLVKAASWPRSRFTAAAGSSAGSSGTASPKVCKRSEKPLFTVVGNVADATETQEIGENQNIIDNLKYCMDGLVSGSALAVRCLSCCNLASQAASPSFRQALRSQSATTSLFSRLQDAPKSKSLALCTAAIFFMLSRDRLNMDLDKSALELLVELLRYEKESDWLTCKSDDKKQYGKMQTKIRLLLQNTSIHGVHHLDLDNLTASQLACEALLALMSSLVGNAHRDDLRTFGGLRRLVNLVSNYSGGLPDERHCVAPFPDNLPRLLDQVSRPVHVLADAVLKDRSANAYLVRDASRHSRQNQAYIVQCSQGAMFTSLSKMIEIGTSYICQANPTEGSGVSEEDRRSVVFSLCPALRLLVSLTHEREPLTLDGRQRDDLLEAVLRCVVDVPRHADLAEELQINFVLQAVCLLLNLSMHSWSVQSALLSLRPTWLVAEDDSGSTVVALLTVCERYQTAASAYDLDALLDNRLAAMKAAVAALPSNQTSPDNSPAANNSESAESIASAKEQVYGHMQRSLVAAYVAMLIGLLAQSSSACRVAFCHALGNDSRESLIKLLNYFLSFLKMTNMANETETELITNIVKMLEGFGSTTRTPAAACLAIEDSVPASASSSAMVPSITLSPTTTTVTTTTSITTTTTMYPTDMETN